MQNNYDSYSEVSHNTYRLIIPAYSLVCNNNIGCAEWYIYVRTLSAKSKHPSSAWHGQWSGLSVAIKRRALAIYIIYTCVYVSLIEYCGAGDQKIDKATYFYA